MYYVNKKVMEQLKRLIELSQLSDDLFDTATRIKENKNGEFDELNKFIDNEVANGYQLQEEEVQKDILDYVHFNEFIFELKEGERYTVWTLDQNGLPIVYFKAGAGTIDYKYAGEFDNVDHAEGFTQEDAKVLAKIVDGSIEEI